MSGVDGFNISPKKLEVKPTTISPYYIIGMAFQSHQTRASHLTQLQFQPPREMSSVGNFLVSGSEVICHRTPLHPPKHEVICMIRAPAF